MYKPVYRPLVANPNTVQLALEAARRPFKSSTHAPRDKDDIETDKNVIEALHYVLRTGSICEKFIKKYEDKL